MVTPSADNAFDPGPDTRNHRSEKNLLAKKPVPKKIRESFVVKRILALLKDRGAYATKNHGEAYQPIVLDITICYRGVFISLECKRSAKEITTPRQLYVIDLIRRAGGIAEVVWSEDQVKAILLMIDAKKEEEMMRDDATV